VSARLFVLAHDTARARAAQAIAEAPAGYSVRIAPPKRDSAINAALHASLGEIAERVEWAGRRWDAETWKRLLVAAWARAARESVVMLPALDGHGVDIVFRRTSEMSQAEMRDLLTFVDAWKAERPEFADETPLQFDNTGETKR
jgi:hypothetical protein